MAGAAVVTLALVGFALYARLEPAPERSIAVLQFHSMSPGEENSYFADGIEEDVLAQLTKIPDLKVISRTSVMDYRGTKRNLRTLARELGVAFVLEGSVRRDGTRIRVVAQLINARTDKHVWAETYDREFTDLFAIQSEIAQSIAQRLHADAPRTRGAPMARPPTRLTAAYDEYLRARSLRYSTPVSEIDYPTAERQLEHAIQLDPAFTLAYAELTRLHAGKYWVGLDPSPRRAEAAARALESAIRLDPDGAETHLAAGYYHYWVRRDYKRALRELGRVREQIPGSGEVLHLTGVIMRRNGQLDSAIHYLNKAAQLDPARSVPFTYLAESLAAVGRFAEANRVYQLALAKAPDDPYTLRMYGEMYIAWRGETDTLRAASSRMARGARVLGGAPAARFRVAMLERNCSAAAAAVKFAPELMSLHDFIRPRALYEAWAAECAGERERARSSYLKAMRIAQRMLDQDLPEPAAYMSLGQALVGLGRYEEGLAAAQKALSLLPYEHDAFDGGYLITEQAALFVRAGENEAALALLERYAGRPFAPWPNNLRLDPRWDALRGSPRFQRLASGRSSGIQASRIFANTGLP